MQRITRTTVIVVFTVAICFATQLGMKADAASVTSTQPTSLNQQCVVHRVTLHDDAAPADIKCVKSSSNGISPDTTEGACGDVTLNIYSSTMGLWCFDGTGYLGLGGTTSGDIYSVYQVADVSINSAWVMYYNPPFTQGTGIKFGLASHRSYGNPPFGGQQKITQVCLQTSSQCGV